MNHRLSNSTWSFQQLLDAGSSEELDPQLGARDVALECARDVNYISLSDVERSLTADGHPTSLYIPDGYEPGYPYPLLVWFHGHGCNELEIQQLMPQISERNFFALGIRGSQAVRRTIGTRFGWSDQSQDVSQTAETLREMVGNLRKLFHIHSERIFLGGNDCGGTMALSVMLERPEWFAGVASLSGGLPDTPTPLTRFRGLQGKHVFMGTDQDNPAASHGTARLLHSAGMQVRQHESPTADTRFPEVLRSINLWLMTGMGSRTVIS